MTAIKLLTSTAKGVITNISKTAQKITKISDEAGAKLEQKGSTLYEYETRQAFKDSFENPQVTGIDKLELNKIIQSRAREQYARITRENIDTDITCAKILGTDRTVYLESLTINKNPINDRIIDYSRCHSFNDVANIFYKADGYYNEAYIEEAIKLLDKYPLQDILKAMPEAIMKNAKGYKQYEKGVLEFFIKNPGARSTVIVKGKNGEEIFDKVLADKYSILKAQCKDNNEVKNVLKSRNINENPTLTDNEYGKGELEFFTKNPEARTTVIVKGNNGEEIFDKVLADKYHILDSLCNDSYEMKNVLKSCRVYNSKNPPLTHKDLYDLALAILNKHKKWTIVEDMLFNQHLKYKVDYTYGEVVNERLIMEAQRLFSEGKTPNEILHHINWLKFRY